MKTASWTYAETFVEEDAALVAARARGEQREGVGVEPMRPGAVAALRVLAAATGARAVIELGTGTGVSGLGLLSGMPADGILTSVDSDGEMLMLAKQAFLEAGHSARRFRLIAGDALDVLSRMTERHYDLLLLGVDTGDHAAYLDPALRLLRPGGLLVADAALWHDAVADPARMDARTRSVRTLNDAVRERDDLTTTLLGVGDGLLVAVYRPAE